MLHWAAGPTPARAEGTVASFGPVDGTAELTTVTLPMRAILGRDAGGRPVVLVADEGLSLERFDGQPRQPVSIAMPEDAGLLAFYAGLAGDVRIATVDPTRTRVALIGTDGARETRISDDSCPDRFVSAAFDGQGRLHVAADRCDGAHLVYIGGDAVRGLHATTFTPNPERRFAHPMVSIGPADQALVVFASHREDLSEAELDLAVVTDAALTDWRRVGPYDLEAERFTAAIVDGSGHIFIGGWANFSGDGVVRTNAPAPDAG